MSAMRRIIGTAHTLPPVSQSAHWRGPWGELVLTGTDSVLLSAVFVSDTARVFDRQPLPNPWGNNPAGIKILLSGTALQLTVWQALSTIQPGETISYAELAQRVGYPRAVRAVASAVASNPLPIILPCHRVIRSDGHSGEYLGGAALKQQLLDWEKTHDPLF